MTERRANRLAGQTSPYLLQHRHNPVDWYPWGPEALAKAREEDKPIFLSIGYAACHWCHVMERESFENDAIAARLNASFVPLKVDREERPDLDEIYMTAVQMMTGHGGWPLSVFLSPDGKPFLGGTYFPPEDRGGMRGFPAILDLVRDAWATRRGEIAESAAEITSHLEAAAVGGEAGPAAPSSYAALSAAAASSLAARFDPDGGGFGRAPKFPPSAGIALLLREDARRPSDGGIRRMAEITLDRMARGGLYDQIGGGFARYSTDDHWLVPHFEKMLYDQALLLPVYGDAWRLARKPLYRRVVLETLDFVRREMTSPEGGFYASLDADSEGHEGRFYVWTRDEIDAVLGPSDGAFFRRIHDLEGPAHFEGRLIPNAIETSLEEWAASLDTTEDDLAGRLRPMREKLLAARERRPRPATDDKVLTSWNGLMISACARAYETFGREEDLVSARRAAAFVLARLTRGERLLATWREGTAHLNAYLDDYAFMARALVDLYEAELDGVHLDRAEALARTMCARFSDGRGGFHFTSDDHETLIARTRSTYDGALPAGAAVAAEALLRLGIHRDDEGLRRAGQAALSALLPEAARAPAAFATLLAAAAYADLEATEIAIVGPVSDPRTAALLAAARDAYVPARALAVGATDAHPLLRGKATREGVPAAFVCRKGTCGPPLEEPGALRAALVSRS